MEPKKKYTAVGIYVRPITVITMLFLNIPLSFGQVRLLSDNDLYNAGLRYYNDRNYRQAEVYLFALVQKSPDIYRSNTEFKNQIDRILKVTKNPPKPGSNQATAETSAQMDEGPSLGTPLNNVFKNTGTVTAASNFVSGTYRDQIGYTYYINKIGNKVWWVSADAQSRWGYTFSGKISGSMIEGEWAAFPVIPSSQTGTIKLRVQNSTTLLVQEVRGNITYGSILRLKN
ncbi:MAG: hypothetical protein JWN56_2148 [Sphingobacteriales bacterium]|nr:hypothetical protein [Sphingobacteriales bacterium]